MVDAYTNGAIGHAGVALSFAFVIVAMIYAVGHLSGAHLNPAVTIGFWSVGRFPSTEVVPYILSQLAGATAAAAESTSSVIGISISAGARQLVSLHD